MFLQYGTTPLVWAARKGHLECVKYLLQMGADVDQEGAVSKKNVIFPVIRCVWIHTSVCPVL